MGLSPFFLFFMVSQIVSSKCLAVTDSNNTKNDEALGCSSSMSVRLNHLEGKSNFQMQKIEQLELKVDMYEGIIMKKMEDRFNGIFELLSKSGGLKRRMKKYIPLRKKRGYRLFPSHILKGRKKGNYVANEILPSNCQDLNNIGYTLNGFFLVKNKQATNTNQLAVISCDFQADSSPSSSSDQNAINQTTMGYVDLIKPIAAQKGPISIEPFAKPEAVHFCVQKGCKNSHNKDGPVPFDLVKLNLGNAFNPSNGVFTAPRPGVYQFIFNGKKALTSNLLNTNEMVTVFLRVNGVNVAGGASLWGFPSHPLSLHSTLKLKRGDKVDLFKTVGTLDCDAIDGKPSSHFTGSLLQEV